MALFALDTDIASLYLQGHPSVVAQMTGRIEDTIAVPIVVAQELLAGWLPLLTRQQSGERMAQTYTAFHRTLDFLADFPILDFDPVVAERFDQLRQRYRRSGSNDLRIAAIALANGATLVTRNTVHFSEIAGLRLADWSQL